MVAKRLINYTDLIEGRYTIQDLDLLWQMENHRLVSSVWSNLESKDK